VINFTGTGPLTLRQVYVLAGSLIVNTPGDLVVMDAATAVQQRRLPRAAECRWQRDSGLPRSRRFRRHRSRMRLPSARPVASPQTAPLTSLQSVSITAGGSIREIGAGDDSVDRCRR
jgi:hypothetical protein